MKKKSEKKEERKKPYKAPKILATYKKEELEEIIKPHGTPQGSGPGCGGGGTIP